MSKSVLELYTDIVNLEKGFYFGYSNRSGLEIYNSKEENVDGVNILIIFESNQARNYFEVKKIGVPHDNEEKEDRDYDLIYLSKCFASEEEMDDFARSIAREIMGCKESISSIISNVRPVY
jgi:hypothetical protein